MSQWRAARDAGQLLPDNLTDELAQLVDAETVAAKDRTLQLFAGFEP